MKEDNLKIEWSYNDGVPLEDSPQMRTRKTISNIITTFFLAWLGITALGVIITAILALIILAIVF